MSDLRAPSGQRKVSVFLHRPSFNFQVSMFPFPFPMDCEF